MTTPESGGTGSKPLQVDPLPQAVADGATVLVATHGDPTDRAVCLHALAAHARPGDLALVVTTTESGDRTTATYEGLVAPADRATLGLVDTTAGQSITALHAEPPVVYTPGPNAIEQLVIALSDLFERLTPVAGERHLVVRSVTPLLAALPADTVASLLARVVGLRSEGGLNLIGIDYSAHDEATMATLGDCVDGVLWATFPSADRLAFEYRPTGGGTAPDGPPP